MGEVATNGIVVVFVHSVVDPLKPGRFYAPDKGNRFIALDVSIQNTSDKTVSYNELYTSLKTTDNHEFNGSIFTEQEPTLKSGDLDPQETARGWVTF